MRLASTPPALALRAITTSAPVMDADDLEAFIRNEFRSISQVESVSVDHEDGSVFVWVAVNNPVQRLRHEIYAKQMSVIEAFPEISFDFNLVCGT